MMCVKPSNSVLEFLINCDFMVPHKGRNLHISQDIFFATTARSRLC